MFKFGDLRSIKADLKKNLKERADQGELKRQYGGRRSCQMMELTG